MKNSSFWNDYEQGSFGTSTRRYGEYVPGTIHNKQNQAEQNKRACDLQVLCPVTGLLLLTILQPKNATHCGSIKTTTTHAAIPCER